MMALSVHPLAPHPEQASGGTPEHLAVWGPRPYADLLCLPLEGQGLLESLRTILGHEHRSFTVSLAEKTAIAYTAATARAVWCPFSGTMPCLDLMGDKPRRVFRGAWLVLAQGDGLTYRGLDQVELRSAIAQIKPAPVLSAELEERLAQVTL